MKFFENLTFEENTALYTKARKNFIKLKNSMTTIEFSDMIFHDGKIMLPVDYYKKYGLTNDEEFKESKLNDNVSFDKKIVEHVLDKLDESENNMKDYLGYLETKREAK